MSETYPDLEFLLKAANYGGADGQYSESARKAVDAVAEKYRVGAERDLAVLKASLEVRETVQDEASRVWAKHLRRAEASKAQ